MRRLVIFSLACGLVAFAIQIVRADIVINEFSYDDQSTDDLEFVELYNSGGASVDISGWTLGTRDAGGVGVSGSASSVIPAATTLGAGAYYVIGNAAVVPNLTRAGDFLENDGETLELRSGPFATAPLVDAVVYETNKGTASYGVLPADVAAQVGPTPGLWGNHNSNQTGSVVNNTLGRYTDGLDTNVNGRDFGTRNFTPGATNNTGVVSDYTPTDVDGATVGTSVANFHGSFVLPRVINPALADANNPNAIPVSPQGGKAIIAWDPTGVAISLAATT